MTLKTFLAGAAAFLLIGCATTSGSGTGNYFVDTTTPEGKLFGDYLSASYADELDDAGARAAYSARAFSQKPDDVALGRRAATAAFAAGDMKIARKLAEDIIKIDKNEPMSRAILGTRAFASGRNSLAEKYFEAPTIDLSVGIVMNIMRGWNAVEVGDTEKARTIFASLGGGGYFDVLGRLQTANIDSSLGNVDAAVKAYDLVDAASLSPIESVLSRARAMSVAGDIDGALIKLKAFNEENGKFETGPIPRYLSQLGGGDPIEEVLSPQQEASRALTEASFGFFRQNRAFDVAEVYLRFALELDPDHDKAKLWLGSLLENSERSDEAMALYRSVPESSYYVVPAKLSQANMHFTKEEDEIAIALLEETNAKHTSYITRESLGRARLIRENYADALPIYDALVKSMSEEKIKENPEPLYFRGICYERLKQWDNAVADFKKVLEVSPDNADALNYLGYTWVDRNENLDEAFAMIRKAVKLEPKSGAIIDSLGWAHYKLGQYHEAKVQLEKAVTLAPSSATIIDHLGDTYWKLGRFREAGYQWKRALEFDPTDEERQNIETKLNGGLDSLQVLP